MALFFALIYRDILLTLRSGGGALLASIFFLTIISIVPFAIGPDLPLLAKIGGAILWFAALLSVLLGLDRLFQSDFDDGSMDQLFLSAMPLEMIVIAKMLAHWLTTGLPLVIISPLLGLMLNLDLITLYGVMMTLLIGTPALTAVGAIGAALTVSLPRGGLLLAIIMLPMSIPILIFAVSAVENMSINHGDDFKEALIYLSGISLLYIALSPLAAALALRHRG